MDHRADGSYVASLLPAEPQGHRDGTQPQSTRYPHHSPVTQLQQLNPERRNSMRVLIAPDCFGGTLTAVEAAEAIAAGWRSSAPDDGLVLRPLADGGPGFVDVLHTSLGGE